MQNQPFEQPLRIIMNKSKQVSDSDLNELYKTRKSKYRSPASIKRAVLFKNTQQSTSLPSMKQLTGVAVAASIMLLVSLIVIQDNRWFQNSPPVEYTWVEVHSLAEDSVDLATNVRQKNAQHYADFLKQEDILEQRYKKEAVLQIVDQDWELKTCKQELVKISAELVASLKSMDRVGQQIGDGDFVSISFDKNGLIVGIAATPQLPHC